MGKKARRSARKQGQLRRAGSALESLGHAVQQLVLPMLATITATKQGLLELVHRLGVEALQQLLVADAERLVGPKGKWNPTRELNHWGTTVAEIALGGRKTNIRRPRVRRGGRKGVDVALPALEELAAEDPLSERVMEQIAVGVSTRKYKRSLEALAPDLSERGTSKSAVSRTFIAHTAAKLANYLTGTLKDRFVVLFLDGIEFAERTVVVAMGVTAEGIKIPLGLQIGSTENATICTALLQGLIERGFQHPGRILCVIDGGKGIRKALRDVFGDAALVQRCQVHKLRNVRDVISSARCAEATRMMCAAYKSKNAKTALGRLRQLTSWLNRNGEEAAAESVREGMRETITILALTQSPTLRRSLATTNAIENVNRSLRRTAKNVSRWRNDAMVHRWVSLGLKEAGRGLRRMKGYRDLPALVAALSGAAPPAAAENAA